VSAEIGVDPARVVAELRELQELTGDENGAQRLCWTPTWRKAREWLRAKLEELPLELETDPAGNAWATLRGELRESVVVGGHIDSVPGGGWLDGALNLLAGAEVLRLMAARGTPDFTVKLVDWADEEGARFGYGMFGSSAASGSLDIELVRRLRDRDGAALPDVLRANDVELDRAREAHAWLDGAVAYLELHIEQGPVLEQLDLPLAAVVGTYGVERHIVRFKGQAAHAGATPMEDRRDPLAAAGRLLLAVRQQARAAGSLATVGRCAVRPGIATAVAGEVEITVDQRHLDDQLLADLLAQARDVSAEIAAEEKVEVEWSRLWGIEPVAFHPELVDIVDGVIVELVGESPRMPSGPLHDAAEVARAGVPTVMLFVQSLRGLSHTKEEDTRPEHIELSVRALTIALERTIKWAQGGARRAT
jgi:hydantoinase/carbamoylase family amidase